jgi:hypothetical protein
MDIPAYLAWKAEQRRGRAIAWSFFVLGAIQPALSLGLYIWTPHFYSRLTSSLATAIVLAWLGFVLVVVGACFWPTTIRRRIGLAVICALLFVFWNTLFALLARDLFAFL